MTTSRAFDPHRDRIDEQASNWVVLASERELTRIEQAELDAWRAADPRHETAWRDFSRTWSEVPNLSHLAALVPLRAEKSASRDEAAPRPRSRKAIWSAVAAVLVAVIAIPAYLFPAGSGQREYATQLAQSRLITLPDGTQVTLGPRSSLKVKFEDGERRVALTGGEAFFEVVHDERRPFLVEAGGSQVRVLGTKFDVNYSDQSLRVAVLQGLVEVSDRPKAGPARSNVKLLRAGQRAEILLAARGAVTGGDQSGATMAALPAQSPGAWREGRLVYQNARLADLVADVNRYYAPGVTLSDPAIGDLRVTASFKASEIPAFLSAVGGVVAVRAEEGPNGAFRLKPSP